MDVDNAVKWANPAGPVVPTKHIETVNFVDKYEFQERKMEALAKQRGIRPNFFSYLQRARDQARLEHRDCASEIRQ